MIVVFFIVKLKRVLLRLKGLIKLR